MHAPKRTTRGCPYLFFVFWDARVILIILRKALFIGCESDFSCMCVCVMDCDEGYM